MTTLLDSGANIEAGAGVVATALHFAALEGQVEAIVALLAAGADIEAKDRDGGTPLDYAKLDKQNVAVATLELFQALQTGEDPQAILRAAAGEGVAAEVTAALALGADPDGHDKDLETALHKAARGCHREVVKVLIGAGADPTARNIVGDTPWAIAKRTKDEPCIEAFESKP